MRALRLDYAARRETGRVGTVILAAGLVLGALALLEHRAVREELTAQESRLAESRASGKRVAAGAPGSAGDVQAAAQDLKAARLALQRLSLRWDRLFSALESAQAGGVALLAIEPDPGGRTVKLSAEARSADDMLDYVARLQAADALADVILASHQIKQGDPLQPLRFAVVASWARQP